MYQREAFCDCCDGEYPYAYDDEREDGWTLPLNAQYRSVSTDAYCFDQYDLMMTDWYAVTDYDSETKMANVFDAEQDEILCAISYSTASEKTEVSYEIYKDPKEDDPSSGTLLEKGVNRHRYAGSHKIDLKQEYPLNQGERYAVVLTMKRVTDADGTMAYTEGFPYSTEFFDGMSVRGVINLKESYLYTDGAWKDMARMKGSLIDRAYEQGVEAIGSDKKLPQINISDRDTFTVDNYPIKAILAPAGGS